MATKTSLLRTSQRFPAFLYRSRFSHQPYKNEFKIIKRRAYATRSSNIHEVPSGSSSASTAVTPPGRNRPVLRPFQAYARSQKKRPYTTQLCTTVITFFLGDLSAQTIRGEEYDPFRGARAATIGGLAAIPTYKWFVYLATHFNYPSKALTLLTKAAISQAIFAPLSTSFFFGMHTILSGLGVPAAWERIKNTLPQAYVNSCKVWPAATAFSFTFVGVQYHAVFLGAVSVGWMTYVSWLNRAAEERQKRAELEGVLN